MKNKFNLKVFGITLLFVLLLTWVIPSSTISGQITIGKIAPTGIADIFSTIEVLTTYFANPAIFILFVGMFYGVANKTGSFKALVNKFASIFKEKKNLFAIITILFYSLSTALCGIYLPMFMFIPLSIAILMKLKYGKSESILATVGASTIGLMAQLFNPTIKAIVGDGKDQFLWFKLGLLIVLLLITIIYLIKVSNKEKLDKNEDSIMFVPETRNAEKKVNTAGTSLFIVISLLFIVFVLGLTNWNTNVFQDAYTAIKDFKIGNFAIFASILGAFETFGTWSYTSMFTTIALAIIVLSISNHLKFGEMIEGCIEGAKKVIGVAFIAILLNLILVFTLNSGFLGTVVNFISKGIRTRFVVVASLVGAPFMVDLNYALQYLLSCVLYTTNKQDLLSLYALIVQTSFGFISLIAPTSVLLMTGLYYVEEDYSKWFKYIWKFIILVFIVLFIFCIVIKYFAL